MYAEQVPQIVQQLVAYLEQDGRGRKSARLAASRRLHLAEDTRAELRRALVKKLLETADDLEDLLLQVLLRRLEHAPGGKVVLEVEHQGIMAGCARPARSSKLKRIFIF